MALCECFCEGNEARHWHFGRKVLTCSKLVDVGSFYAPRLFRPQGDYTFRRCSGPSISHALAGESVFFFYSMLQSLELEFVNKTCHIQVHKTMMQGL